VKLHTKLLLALVAGFAAGAIAHAYGASPTVDFIGTGILRPIGQIFLRLIFMTVVPMVFAALVIGVYELGREHGLGGVAARTLLFTLVLSTMSVSLGVVLVNVLRPGAGLPQSGTAEAAGEVKQLETNAAAAQPLGDVFIELIPRNPLDSAVRALDGQMLPLMVFALIFGYAISRGERGSGSGERGSGIGDRGAEIRDRARGAGPSRSVKVNPGANQLAGPRAAGRRRDRLRRADGDVRPPRSRIRAAGPAPSRHGSPAR